MQPRRASASCTIARHANIKSVRASFVVRKSAYVAWGITQSDATRANFIARFVVDACLQNNAKRTSARVARCLHRRANTRDSDAPAQWLRGFTTSTRWRILSNTSSKWRLARRACSTLSIARETTTGSISMHSKRAYRVFERGCAKHLNLWTRRARMRYDAYASVLKRRSRARADIIRETSKRRQTRLNDAPHTIERKPNSH